MPIRIPEVNGTPARPAASIAASRTAGSLSGQPWCGPPGSQSRAATDSSIIPCETLTFRSRARLVLRQHAGIDVGQQAGLGEHERAHRRQILDRRTVAEPVDCRARGRMRPLPVGRPG